ncbi:Uncharacterised protein [Salmonella enterica]|nr:Uncharacterised protein [Salmonella enterica]
MLLLVYSVSTIDQNIDLQRNALTSAIVTAFLRTVSVARLQTAPA